ncbi:hypothetical protein QFC19_005517 [Naganishia cerealis]|uniref:Uncharacterized protein n=1 Tax=Naganishia cerealis TaxID=610337 RepID=A0ACC2VN11_9TREE|nr:hypothetical protein QFC19_005517 [Naganishia cerealis]
MVKSSFSNAPGPSEGITQAPTVPSVSAHATNFEAAQALNKKQRRSSKKQNKSGDREGSINVGQNTTSEPSVSGKKKKNGKKRSGDKQNEDSGAAKSKKKPTKSERKARAAAVAAAAETRGSPRQPEQKKKKEKSRASERKSETSSHSRSQPANPQQSSGMSASNPPGRTHRKHRGGIDREDSNATRIIGTGDFVADSLPQNSRKRKFDRMQQEHMRTVGSRNLAPWCADIDWFSASNMTQLLNDEILACSAWMSPSFEEHESRCMMIQKIISIIQQSESGARVYAFGSHETKLYLPGGDIDIVIDIDSVRVRNPHTLFATLVNRLVNRGICRSYDVEKILHARVPIIKLKTIQGNIKIDISLYNTNGVKAGEVVKQYLDALPAARPLVLLVKAFMWRMNKNERYYTDVYPAITKQHPKIRNNEIDPMKNLGILLIEFFELYGLNFNWKDLGISIREGGSYYRKRDRGWLKQSAQPNISIEDPQDKSE